MSRDGVCPDCGGRMAQGARRCWTCAIPIRAEHTRVNRWGDATNEERLWARVDRSGGETACWIWNGNLSGAGYGYHHFGERQRAVHRISYELVHGPIPDGFQVDHLCRVRRCVNPAHLEAVTPAENNRRANLAKALARDTCRRGHPWEPYTPGEDRNCRVCMRARNRKAAQARRDRLREATHAAA